MATCKLLSLPAELRNQIYNEVFHSQAPGQTNLMQATPPSGTILLTCQQINQEAQRMHQTACQAYWRDTHFFLDAYHINAGAKARLQRMRLAEIQNLSLHFRLWFPRQGPGLRTVKVKADLLDKRGIWRTNKDYDGWMHAGPVYRAVPPYSDGTGVEMCYMNYATWEEAEEGCERFEAHARVGLQVLSLLTWFEDMWKMSGAEKVKYMARS